MSWPASTTATASPPRVAVGAKSAGSAQRARQRPRSGLHLPRCTRADWHRSSPGYPPSPAMATVASIPATGGHPGVLHLHRDDLLVHRGNTLRRLARCHRCLVSKLSLISCRMYRILRMRTRQGMQTRDGRAAPEWVRMDDDASLPDTTVWPGLIRMPPISTTSPTWPVPVFLLVRGFVPSGPDQPRSTAIAAIRSPTSAHGSDPPPSTTRNDPGRTRPFRQCGLRQSVVLEALERHRRLGEPPASPEAAQLHRIDWSASSCRSTRSAVLIAPSAATSPRSGVRPHGEHRTGRFHKDPVRVAAQEHLAHRGAAPDPDHAELGADLSARLNQLSAASRPLTSCRIEYVTPASSSVVRTQSRSAG